MYLIPPTKILFGINVPYLGADKGASICAVPFGCAVILAMYAVLPKILLPFIFKILNQKFY